MGQISWSSFYMGMMAMESGVQKDIASPGFLYYLLDTILHFEDKIFLNLRSLLMVYSGYIPQKMQYCLFILPFRSAPYSSCDAWLVYKTSTTLLSFSIVANAASYPSSLSVSSKMIKHPAPWSNTPMMTLSKII